MGKPTNPTTPAPAYEDLFHNHPLNQHPPPSSSSAVSLALQSSKSTPFPLNTGCIQATDIDPQYIPLNEADDESFMHDHDPLAQPHDQPQAESLLPTSNLAPHTHCETCERRHEREQRSRHGLQCCRMVAATFMVLFVCAMLVTIVAITGGH